MQNIRKHRLLMLLERLRNSAVYRISFVMSDELIEDEEERKKRDDCAEPPRHRKAIRTRHAIISPVMPPQCEPHDGDTHHLRSLCAILYEHDFPAKCW